MTGLTCSLTLVRHSVVIVDVVVDDVRTTEQTHC